MITKITTNLDLKKEFVALIVEEPDKKITSGEYLKLYVPSVMSGIKQAEAKESIVTSKGSDVFLNAPACKPKAKKLLKEKNYMEGKLSNNASIEPLYQNSDTLQTKKVQAKFVNGRLSDLQFNTNNF